MMDAARRGKFVTVRSSGFALAVLVTAGVLVPSQDAAAPKPRLAAGFHLLEVPGFEPPLRASIVVPRGEPPPAGHPVAIVPAPGLPLAGDELLLRARYGAFLDLGWIVHCPVPPHIGAAPGAAVTGRDPWFDGPDVAAAFVADLADRHPVDRDRILFMTRHSGLTPESAEELPLPPVNATALAALHVVLPGTLQAAALPDPGLWRGRLLAIHRSTHGGDAVALFAARLADEAPARGWRTWTAADPALDYTGRMRFTPEALRPLLAEVRRGAAPDEIDFEAGPGRASGFEWLEARGLEGRTRLRATRRDGTVTIESAGSVPAGFDVYFETAPARVKITLGERVLFEGASPGDAEAALLLARKSRLDGRSYRAVVRAAAR